MWTTNLLLLLVLNEALPLNLELVRVDKRLLMRVKRICPAPRALTVGSGILSWMGRSDMPLGALRGVSCSAARAQRHQ